MDVCKTDIKNIIQFLEESAALAGKEATRRRTDGHCGSIRMENRARLMRQMARKLDKKLKTTIQETNYD